MKKIIIITKENINQFKPVILNIKKQKKCRNNTGFDIIKTDLIEIEKEFNNKFNYK